MENFKWCVGQPEKILLVYTLKSTIHKSPYPPLSMKKKECKNSLNKSKAKIMSNISEIIVSTLFNIHNK